MRSSVVRAFATGVVIGLAAPAIGQEPAARPDTVGADLKVLVTGSHIPTIERETFSPVQVITREQIERTNLQTAAQLAATISAATSFSASNDTQLVAAGGGFSGVALRGLGVQFTLVLVNGRRVAHFANAARGADLGAIPLAAVERVEVLKDGASAIYGSDAIGGVINFILRKEYQGVEATAQYTSPEHTGGYSKRLTASAGYGDLAIRRFNAYATVDYQKFGGVQERDRPFASRRYIPEVGLDRTETESVPANVNTPAGLRNPSGDPGAGYRDPSCAPPLSSVTRDPYQCRWFGDGSMTIVDPSERLHVVGALTWQFDPDHQFFLNGTWSRNQFTYRLGPTAVSNQTTNLQLGSFLLPSASAFYPREFANAFDIPEGAPLNVFWRAAELGPQTFETTTQQWGVVAGLQGMINGWSYNSALNYNRSEVDNRYLDGFVRESVLLPILNSGIVNPFGSNTQDVIDRMSEARIDGVLRRGRLSITALDFRASKDILRLPAGPLALATGVDVFEEKLVQVADPALAAGDVLDTAPLASFSASRTVWAVFAETNVPLLRSLEANVAVRFDHYGDFGGTTNPKVSVRWQPASNLLLRTSAGTGFLAPGLLGLYNPPRFGLTDEMPDPARCPTTMAPQDCDRRFPTLTGGNPALQPVKSRHWNVGVVWAPLRELSMGVDYAWTMLDDRINFYGINQLFLLCPDGVTGPTCHLIHRGPADPVYPELPGPIVLMDTRLNNLSKAKVSAIDVDLQYSPPAQSWGQIRINFTGTYNIERLEQQADGSYLSLVGRYSTVGGAPGVIPRWRHYLVIDWSQGPWSVTVTENYQTSVHDQPLPGIPPRRIGAYDIWNLGFAYSGFRNWSLSAGIKNLFDRDPPFSIQRASDQVGYDPSFADPRGRLYWAAVGYSFK